MRPLTPRYKMSASAHASDPHDADPVTAGSKYVCFMGAPESVLEHCSETLVDDVDERGGAVVKELDDEKREEIAAEIESEVRDGMRVVAFAQRQIDDSLLDTMEHNDAMFWGLHDWTFLCTVSISDPHREEAAEVIQHLTGDLCCEVVICTGDDAVTARAFAASVGIEGAEEEGAVCEELTDGSLDHYSKNTTVFARTNPEQKCEVVKWIKRNRDCKVLFVGASDNDSLVMEAEADLGIAMGGSSVQMLTKKAADVLLMDEDLNGVVEIVKVMRNGGHFREPEVVDVVPSDLAPAPAQDVAAVAEPASEVVAVAPIVSSDPTPPPAPDDAAVPEPASEVVAVAPIVNPTPPSAPAVVDVAVTVPSDPTPPVVRQKPKAKEPKSSQATPEAAKGGCCVVS